MVEKQGMGEDALSGAFLQDKCTYFNRKSAKLTKP